MCPNHVQCDIVPFSHTSEVVLPSYQHYLEREHHLKGAKVNESEALNQFGKTIFMLILARVNGYYSPYTAQTIKGEEDRCFFGSVFTHSEKEFFKHRLQSKFPKINNKSLDTALNFLEKQKLANCPCQVHTASRGHDWVVFKRQPDRTPTLYYEQTESESEEEIQEEYNEDDDYFSVEPVDIDNDEEKEDQDVTGAAASSEVPADETAKKSEPGDNLSIRSRENEEEEKKENKSQKKSTDNDEEDMESQNSDDTDEHMDTTGRRRTNYICFKPLMYYNRHLDRYYYFRYFKPYNYDHRLLAMGHDCGCQPRRLHKTSCSWYDDDNIYIIDSQADLSISEKAAQQKIYKIYMETLNNLPDECGCGTLASIFYMGHSTSCDVHERESHEVLLAILNKKKKLSFDAEFDPRHQNYEVQIDADAVVADTDQVVPIPDAKKAIPELNNSSPQVMLMVAKNVTSVTNLPNNPPNPSSITDIPLMNEEKPGEKPEDEEMLPLVDITDDITG